MLYSFHLILDFIRKYTINNRQNIYLLHMKGSHMLTKGSIMNLDIHTFLLEKLQENRRNLMNLTVYFAFFVLLHNELNIQSFYNPPTDAAAVPFTASLLKPSFTTKIKDFTNLLFHSFLHLQLPVE